MRMPTEKDLLILQFLAEKSERCDAEKSMYGQEMVNASNGKLKRGTVYVYLHRLEGEGYIVSHLCVETLAVIGPPRRIYWLTTKGKKVIAAWQEFRSVVAQTLF